MNQIELIKLKLEKKSKSLNDLMFRSSLVKVDGFDGPDQFEKFVNEANLKANLILKQRDPKRFAFKYGKDASEKSLIKQT